MTNDSKINSIRAQAQHMVNSGAIGDATVSSRIETPIAVQTLDRQHHSWFVPVTAGARLIGFFQFLSDGTFMRFSSFQRKSGELTGCPNADSWLDPDLIQKRAEVHRKPDETSSSPFLTYDRTPDRIVWAVPLTNSRGRVRLVYVAGETVYLPPPEETYG